MKKFCSSFRKYWAIIKINFANKKVKINVGSGFGFTNFDLKDLTFDKDYIRNMIADTKKWVVPMAKLVNKDMLFELQDLLKRRESNMKFSATLWPMKRKE